MGRRRVEDEENPFDVANARRRSSRRPRRARHQTNSAVMDFEDQAMSELTTDTLSSQSSTTRPKKSEITVDLGSASSNNDSSQDSCDEDLKVLSERRRALKDEKKELVKQRDQINNAYRRLQRKKTLKRQCEEMEKENAKIKADIAAKRAKIDADGKGE